MLDIKLKLAPGHTNERSWMEPSPLRTLFWNATYACNYRCTICFTDSAQRHADELTTQEADAMLRDAHAAGVRGIIVSGGEPFLREDVPALLGRMAELGMKARIASNGSVLTDDLLTRLRSESLTQSFQVSLDSLDPDLYHRIHGAPTGMLDSVLENLRRIKAHGFHTTVSVRLTPETLAGIPALLDRASSEGWATVTVHCPVHTRRTAGAFPQDADVLGLLEPVFDHYVALPTRWLVETYVPWAPYHRVMKQLAKRVRVVHRGCRAGRDRLTVNPDGSISPCVCMDIPEAHVGNVRQDRLGDMFTSAPLCLMLRRPQEHGICTDCGNVATCGGGCRASAFALTGRLDGQDGSCPIRRRRQERGPRQPCSADQVPSADKS